MRLNFALLYMYSGGKDAAISIWLVLWSFAAVLEVVNASGKMTFDGSIERINCITHHEDYSAFTNRTVLLQVAPLLKDKDRRSYRRRSDVRQNE